MMLFHRLFSVMDMLHPARVAYAHCDIPCGIYDPHLAQQAAHTVIRMVMLIEEATAKFKALANPIAEDRREFVTKLARYTATKEQHAELCKHEVRILWGDYFKPEHIQKYPELHELVWKVMKLGSIARQSVDMQTAEELLEAANRVAEIFWETKGMGHARYPAPNPTGRQTVYPTGKK
ncbi:MAG: superoxide dismutase, Ni [Candidatus Aenigmarchaeota archaeon]|nr:superoxide dismutase, Ni [Candidatus Aenigmarchaeota archaeon]